MAALDKLNAGAPHQAQRAASSGSDASIAQLCAQAPPALRLVRHHQVCATPRCSRTRVSPLAELAFKAQVSAATRDYICQPHIGEGAGELVR